MWISEKTVLGLEFGVGQELHLALPRLHGRLLPSIYWLLTIGILLHSAPLTAAIPGRYVVKEIKPHVFVWVPEDLVYQVGDPKFDHPGTAAFVITSEGVLVVNTTNSPFNAREMLYEIRERTDLPVKYVINTDSRGDHMLGNEVFVDQGATIISTTAARNQMRLYQRDLARRLEDDDRLQSRMRGIHVTLPTQTFDSDLTLQLGGVEFRLLNLGQGSMEGDAAVYMPQEKVMFLGDLYDNSLISRRPINDLSAWLKILAQVDTMDVLSYVPGEGPPGDKDDFEDFRQFLEWIQGTLDPSSMLDTLPPPGRVARRAVAQ